MIAALLVLLALPVQEPAGHDGAPGPRTPLAGMAAFRSTSKLDFGTAANRLTAVYVFPDRARWCFESYADDATGRQLVYRFGAQVHQLASGAASQAVTGPSRGVVLLQMELRRAAMLWPDGFDWSAENAGTRSAPVFEDSCCKRTRAGSLLASQLGEAGPGRIEAHALDGELVEWIEVRERQTTDGRRWPRVMQVGSLEGGFLETVESVETGVHFLDLAFVPSDQRSVARASEEGPDILASDLVPIAYRARDLPESVSWEDALGMARAWIAETAEELREQKIEVDPVPTFELSPTGRPVRSWVRLRQPRPPLPAGFVLMDERPGLLCSLADIRGVSSALLQRLARSAPTGTQAGIPYVRWHEDPEPRIEVVLPLDVPR